MIEVRRAADRFVTTAPGRTTHHSFSFESHYDPDNVAFGALVCHNDDRLGPRHGYPAHPHRDLEIVTWVLEGALHHEDSLGHRGDVGPGWVQRTSAGTGIVHAEVGAGTEPVRFVQAWVRPDEPGGAPAYDLVAVGTGPGWVVLASGLPRYAGTAATSLASASSALLVGRPGDGGPVALPEAPLLHLFVARGPVECEGVGVLGTGDAVRLTGSGGQRVTARGADAEVLLWELHGS